MKDLSKLLVSVMLAAGQAAYSFQTAAAASAQVPSQAVVTSQSTIQLSTASPTALVVNTPPQPDFDREVLAPLRQTQAAEAAAAAAAAKAAALAAERARAAAAVVYSLPPGSHTDWMAAAGLNSADFGYVNYIFQHESSWNPWACSSHTDPCLYGYAGLGQTSPSNLASACPNWQTDPICQIRYFNDIYLVSHYAGSWARAYAHKVSFGWW